MNAINRFRAIILSLATTAITILPANAESPEMEDLGAAIYLHGIGESGEPIQGIVQNDIRIDGTQLPCVGCHQRSGLGSSEGGILVPPVAGRILFHADETRRPELAEVITRRPAYENSTFRRALVDGVDANGDALDAVMPRYVLSETEASALRNYLDTLSSTPDPGVDDTIIHLATIFDADANPDEVDAIMRIATRYVEEKNSGTRLETQRADSSPWHKDWHYSAYRQWQLHVWTVNGPPDAWKSQLQDYYGEQPVFAIVGGFSDKDWSPVHDFCESNEVPCVLPNILSAPFHAADNYSIYFSEGLSIERGTIDKWLSESNETPRVVLYLSDSGSLFTLNSITVAEHAENSWRSMDIDAAEPDTEQAFVDAVAKFPDATIVAWLPEGHRYWDLLKNSAFSGRLIVSSSLVADHSILLPVDAGYTLMSIHQYQLGPELTQNRRLRAWARSRKIDLDHIRLQANTYYALAIVGDALQHIRSNFHRQYFLEKIEHMSRRILVSSAYAKLSIAPQQRVMSKGSYIVPVGEEGILDFRSAEWVTP